MENLVNKLNKSSMQLLLDMFDSVMSKISFTSIVSKSRLQFIEVMEIRFPDNSDK